MKKVFLSFLTLLLFASYGMAQTQILSSRAKASKAAVIKPVIEKKAPAKSQLSVEEVDSQVAQKKAIEIRSKETILQKEVVGKKISTENQIQVTKSEGKEGNNLESNRISVITQKSSVVTSSIPFQQDIFEGERVEMERLKQADGKLYFNYLKDRDAISDLMSQETNGTISSDSLERLNIFRTTYGLE